MLLLQLKDMTFLLNKGMWPTSSGWKAASPEPNLRGSCQPRTEPDDETSRRRRTTGWCSVSVAPETSTDPIHSFEVEELP